jgi:hypothetical protein
MQFTAGTARRIITPPAHVELAGLGYYLERKGERVRDDLTITALVMGDERKHLAIAAVDMMYNDTTFTRKVRDLVAARTDIKPEAVCVNFSHTHNAPTAGLIIGAGERDFDYLDSAAAAAGEAIIEARQSAKPARLFVGQGDLSDMTFNRTRRNGPVDTRVGVLRVESADGKPMVVLINFHSHCTAHIDVDLNAISRDWPGEVVDQVEAAWPGCRTLYVQGTCGDVNFRREFNGTERRFEPARALTSATFEALKKARPVEGSGVAALCKSLLLPARRWTRKEIEQDREEGTYRLKTGDTRGWLEGVARVCVNLPERLPLRYGGSVEKAVAAVSRFAVEWTEAILPELETRPETVAAEVQVFRIGDVYLIANPAELFTTLGLEVRRRWAKENLFMLSYSNGSIGYLPDAYEIERGSYAAIQSPKFTAQFPFTAESGTTMVKAMLDLLESV